MQGLLLLFLFLYFNILKGIWLATLIPENCLPNLLFWENHFGQIIV